MFCKSWTKPSEDARAARKVVKEADELRRRQEGFELDKESLKKSQDEWDTKLENKVKNEKEKVDKGKEELQE